VISTKDLVRTMTRSVDFSLIVPAYNEESLLPTTLASHQVLLQQLAPEFTGELIVVDNNSTDKTAAVAAAAGARVVFESINQISRARNCGARVARGNFLVFIDADTTASLELVRAALLALRDEPVCGGGAGVGTGEAVSRSVALTMALWNRLGRWRRWAAGSFVFCRRQAWEDVGGFSTNVYAGEEIFFSVALRKWGRRHGQKMRILPQCINTSMRKAQWYPLRRLVPMALILAFCPWLLRRKKYCWLWYERPIATDKSA